MSIVPFKAHSHPRHSAESDSGGKPHDGLQGKATTRREEPGTLEATVRPFPAPGVSYRRRRQELVKGILAEEFRDFCRSHPELTEEQALSTFLEVVKDHHPALHEEMVSHGSGEAVRDDCNRKTPHRHVELYVAFPISEQVRRAFERWLDSHPSISEEDAAAHLLELGLKAEHAASNLLSDDTVRRSTACQWRMAKLRALFGTITEAADSRSTK